MSSVSRYREMLVMGAALAWVPALGMLAYVAGPGRLRGIESRQVPVAPSSPSWPEAADLAACDWGLLQGGGAEGAAGGALAKRYRLAGTFLEYGAEGGSGRKAIVGEIAGGRELIVGEGEVFGDCRVVRVYADRVVVRTGDLEEQLWLTFSGGKSARAGEAAGGEPSPDAVLTGADRFGGKRLGENRWVFERDRLLQYYRELMDEPQRLVKVFDSLEPLYGEGSKIQGYRFRAKGEPEFFSAVGFQEGDVVKRVNAVDMTNRRRAEFFIEQFVSGRASAFVLDVERDGQQVKRVYQVR